MRACIMIVLLSLRENRRVLSKAKFNSTLPLQLRFLQCSVLDFPEGLPTIATLIKPLHPKAMFW